MTKIVFVSRRNKDGPYTGEAVRPLVDERSGGDVSVRVGVTGGRTDWVWDRDSGEDWVWDNGMRSAGDGGMKVQRNREYVFRPCMVDVVLSQHHNVEPGQRVRVVQLPGAPPPNTMGQCHVVDAVDGEFLGMVSVHSLQKA